MQVHFNCALMQKINPISCTETVRSDQILSYAKHEGGSTIDSTLTRINLDGRGVKMKDFNPVNHIIGRNMHEYIITVFSIIVPLYF